MHDVLRVRRDVDPDARAYLISAGEAGGMVIANAVVDGERVRRRPLVLSVQADLPAGLRNVGSDRCERSARVEHAEDLVRVECLTRKIGADFHGMMLGRPKLGDAQARVARVTVLTQTN